MDSLELPLRRPLLRRRACRDGELLQSANRQLAISNCWLRPRNARQTPDADADDPLSLSLCLFER